MFEYTYVPIFYNFLLFSFSFSDKSFRLSVNVVIMNDYDVFFKVSWGSPLCGSHFLDIARSGSVQQVIAEIARSVGAPLSWIPPADLGPSPSDGARPLAQFLQVKGFSHTLQVGPAAFSNGIRLWGNNEGRKLRWPNQTGCAGLDVT